MRRRWGMTAVAALALLPALVACSDGGFAPGTVDLTCPAQPGGPVTLAVGARANSPAPVHQGVASGARRDFYLSDQEVLLRQLRATVASDVEAYQRETGAQR